MKSTNNEIQWNPHTNTHKNPFIRRTSVNAWCNEDVILPFEAVSRGKIASSSIARTHLEQIDKNVTEQYSCACMNMCINVSPLSKNALNSHIIRDEWVAFIRDASNKRPETMLKWLDNPIELVKLLSFGVKFSNLACVSQLRGGKFEEQLVSKQGFSDESHAELNKQRGIWMLLRCACCDETLAVNNEELHVTILAPGVRKYHEVIEEAFASDNSMRFFPELNDLLLPENFLEVEKSSFSPQNLKAEIEDNISKLVRTEVGSEPNLEEQCLIDPLKISLQLLADALDNNDQQLTHASRNLGTNEWLTALSHESRSQVKKNTINTAVESIVESIKMGQLRLHRVSFALEYLNLKEKNSLTQLNLEYANEIKLLPITQPQSPESTALSPLHSQRVVSDDLQLHAGTSAATTFLSSDAMRFIDQVRSSASDNCIASPITPHEEEEENAEGTSLGLMEHSLESGLVARDSMDASETGSDDTDESEVESEFEDVFGVFGINGDDLQRISKSNRHRQNKQKNRRTKVEQDSDSDESQTETTRSLGLSGVVPIASRPVSHPNDEVDILQMEQWAKDVSFARSITIPFSDVLLRDTLKESAGSSNVQDVKKLPEEVLSRAQSQSSLTGPRRSHITSIPPPDLQSSKDLSGTDIEGVEQDESSRAFNEQGSQSIMTTTLTNSSDSFQEPEPIAELSDLTGSEIDFANNIAVVSTGDLNDTENPLTKSKSSLPLANRSAVNARVTSTVVSRVVNHHEDTGSEISVLAASMSSAADESVLTGNSTPFIADLEVVTDESFDPMQILDPTGRGRERSRTRTSLDHRPSRNSMRVSNGDVMQRLQQMEYGQDVNASIHQSYNSPSSPFSGLASGNSPTTSGIDSQSNLSISASQLSISAAATSSGPSAGTKIYHRASPRPSKMNLVRNANSDDEEEDASVDDEDEDYLEYGEALEDAQFYVDQSVSEEDEDEEYLFNQPNFRGKGGIQRAFTTFDAHEEEKNDQRHFGVDRKVDKYSQLKPGKGFVEDVEEEELTDEIETEENEVDGQNDLITSTQLVTSPQSYDDSNDATIARTLLTHGASALASMLAGSKGGLLGNRANNNANSRIEFELEPVDHRPRDTFVPSSLTQSISFADTILNSRNVSSSLSSASRRRASASGIAESPGHNEVLTYKKQIEVSEPRKNIHSQQLYTSTPNHPQSHRSQTTMDPLMEEGQEDF